MFSRADRLLPGRLCPVSMSLLLTLGILHTWVSTFPRASVLELAAGDFELAV